MVGAACCTDYSRRLPNCVKPRLSFRIPRLRHVFVLTLSHFTCLEKPMDHLSCVPSGVRGIIFISIRTNIRNRCTRIVFYGHVIIRSIREVGKFNL